MPKFTPPIKGDMRVHLAIQQITRTPDGAGSFSEAWATIQDVWASMVAWKGTKQLQAMQIQPQQWYEVVFRFIPSLTVLKGMRLMNVNTDEVYEIYSAADPDQHRKWMWVLALSSSE